MDDTPPGAPGIDWGRLALVLILGLLTVRAFGAEDGRIVLLGDIDLAIHEFGHALFRPFGFAFAGETMFILGGSLTQIVFPLIFAIYFIRGSDDRGPDYYAALLCSWWTALNMLDVAVYVGDSRAGRLMMLSGETASDGAPHDWRILLTQWGVLDRDTVYAARLRAAAALLALASLMAAAWLAWMRSSSAPVLDH